MSARTIVLWWVDRYTRGLPSHVRADRREELESDLWEHLALAGPGARAQLAVLSRCLRGVPADLSWRRARRGRRHLPSRAAVARGLGWAFAAGAYAFMTVAHGWASTPLVGIELHPDDWNRDDAALYARASGTLLALLVGGALLLPRWPRLGAACVVAGALATPIAFSWGAVVYGPLGVVVAVAAVALARRRRRVAA